MYWADNVITTPLSVSSIRSLSLCIWAGVTSCQVSAFLWSGAANWLPRQLTAAPPGHCWDISVLSQNKANKVRDSSIDSLEGSRNWWRRGAVPSNYILINPALMIFSPCFQLSRHVFDHTRLCNASHSVLMRVSIPHLFSVLIAAVKTNTSKHQHSRAQAHKDTLSGHSVPLPGVSTAS